MKLTKTSLFLFLCLFAAKCAVSRLEGATVLEQIIPDPTGYQVIDKGQNFAVFSRPSLLTNELGGVTLSTEQFTLLEYGLHYVHPQTGQLTGSQDLVESFPDGAIARHGPNPAIFSSTLDAEVVFDILTTQAGCAAVCVLSSSRMPRAKASCSPQ